jgi:hypothetical protein
MSSKIEASGVENRNFATAKNYLTQWAYLTKNVKERAKTPRQPPNS